MIGLLFFVALPLALIAAAIVVVGVRRRAITPDGTHRVGDESSTDANGAARRAGGNAAWMRGGF